MVREVRAKMENVCAHILSNEAHEAEARIIAGHRMMMKRHLPVITSLDAPELLAFASGAFFPSRTIVTQSVST